MKNRTPLSARVKTYFIEKILTALDTPSELHRLPLDNGGGLYCTRPVNMLKHVERRPIEIAGITLQPGTETDLQGYLPKPLQYVGVYQNIEDHTFQILFYIGYIDGVIDRWYFRLLEWESGSETLRDPYDFVNNQIASYGVKMWRNNSWTRGGYGSRHTTGGIKWK